MQSRILRASCFYWLHSLFCFLIGPPNSDDLLQKQRDSKAAVFVHANNRKCWDVLTQQTASPWNRVILEKLVVAQPTKKIPCPSWNLKVHYRICNNQTLDPILSRLDPVHAFKHIRCMLFALPNSSS